MDFTGLKELTLSWVPEPLKGHGQSLQAPEWALPAAVATVSGTLLFLNRKSIVCSLYDWVASARKGDKNPGKDFLTGNFAPVHDEVHYESCEVEGKLPKELEGAYLRTGPNPYFEPVGGYHWFDGDGMLHGVRIKGGKASYANHQMRTARLAQEQAAKKPLFVKMGDIMGKRGLLVLMLQSLKAKLGVTSEAEGTGTANTALVYHAQRLLVLHEGDLPYQVRMLCDGVIETLGRLRVGGPGSVDPQHIAYPGPFTAHPKVDPKTGEMFMFGYSFNSKPFMRGGMMDKDGHLVKQWAIDVPWPVMAHDCAMTEHYAVILHLPMVFDGEAMVKNDALPLAFDANKPARIGLLRRDAPGLPDGVSVTDPAATPAPVQWFELPAFYAFHVANAWEDKQGRVHLFACHFPEFSFGSFNDVHKQAPPENQRQRLFEYVLDPSNGTHSVRQLTSVYCDFPVVHPNLACYQTKYCWGATFDYKTQDTVEANGIAKYDLTAAPGHDACVGRITYPAGCGGGEAVFVPRNPTSRSEDDGWLVVFVYDKATDKSSLCVYDAHTMSNTPVAKVKLPCRVPYGFHGMWVREEQFKAQKQSL